MKLPVADPFCSVCALGRASQPGVCPFHDVTRTAGTQLLAQGEAPECVWYVREGTVLLSSVSAGGEETFCTIRGAGALIALEALKKRTTDYAAWALSDVILCRIDVDRFDAWLGDRSGPMGAVLDLTLDEALQRRGERTALSGTAVTRVARFLLERMRTAGGEHPLDLEQQVLARMLGMRAETLSRALNKLRDRRAIARGRGVQVVDAEALARAAGESDADADSDDDDDDDEAADD